MGSLFHDLPISVISSIPDIADGGGRSFAAHLLFVQIAVSVLGALPGCPLIGDYSTVIEEPLRLQHCPRRHIVNGMRGDYFVAEVAHYTRLHGKLAVLRDGEATEAVASVVEIHGPVNRVPYDQQGNSTRNNC